ncbi:MAG: hypothetical protein ACRD0U_18225 [Acidimicrobiales bacterium]
MGRLTANVGLVEPLGPEQLVHVSFPGVEPYEVEVASVPEGDGDAEVEPVLRRCVARLGADSVVSAGEVIELAVPVEQVHWFGAGTGDAVPSVADAPVAAATP